MAKTAQLDTEQIPAFVFSGLARLQHAACLVVALDPGAGRSCRAWIRQMAPLLAYGHTQDRELAHVMALTESGLRAVGFDADDLATFPAAFVNGMTAPPRSRALGDIGAHAPDCWDWGNGSRRADAVLLVYAASEDGLNKAIDGIRAAGQDGVTIGSPIWLQPRARGDMHEPFGFRDGVSQPAIPGTPRAHYTTQADPVVAAGEFVLGYPDNRGYLPPAPTVAAMRDPKSILPHLPGSGRDIGANSSFLVIRQLRQDTAGFKRWVGQRAADTGLPAETIATKLLGRWPNGSSLVRNPSRPGRKPDNDFLFGDEDPDGLSCPRGSHVRRANPRDSLHAGLADALGITNRHRILRVGRPYMEERDVTAQGMLFMCLNADIERQFEFIQQSWLMRPTFDGLQNEVDPLIGHNAGSGSLTVPTVQGPLCLGGLPDLVTPIGGGYFWLPSRAAIQFLCDDRGR